MARSAVAGNQPGGSWLWEDLRKEARKLESELDSKLASYSKLGSTGYGGSGGVLPDTSEVETRSKEVEGLLQRLGDVNSAMEDCIKEGGSDILSHTMARHRDILLEFTQEFRRMRTTVSASRQHAELLGMFGSKRDKGDINGSTLDPQQSLFRERGQIHNTHLQIDGVLGQAQATMSALHQQRGLFGDIGSKLSTVAAKFPIVNQVLTDIRKKKNKDTMIITCVVSACTLFVLIYWLNK